MFSFSRWYKLTHVQESLLDGWESERSTSRDWNTQYYTGNYRLTSSNIYPPIHIRWSQYSHFKHLTCGNLPYIKYIRYIPLYPQVWTDESVVGLDVRVLRCKWVYSWSQCWVRWQFLRLFSFSLSSALHFLSLSLLPPPLSLNSPHRPCRVR